MEFVPGKQDIKVMSAQVRTNTHLNVKSVNMCVGGCWRCLLVTLLSLYISVPSLLLHRGLKKALNPTDPSRQPGMVDTACESIFGIMGRITPPLKMSTLADDFNLW